MEPETSNFNRQTELDTCITDARNAGLPRDAIATSLEKEGWGRMEIEDAFRRLGFLADPAPKASTLEDSDLEKVMANTRKKMSIMYSVAGTLVMVVAVSLITYGQLRDKQNGQNQPVAQATPTASVASKVTEMVSPAEIAGNPSKSFAVVHFIEGTENEQVNKVAYVGSWKSSADTAIVGTLVELKNAYDLSEAQAVSTGAATLAASGSASEIRSVVFDLQKDVQIAAGKKYAFVFTMPGADKFAADGKLRFGTYTIGDDFPGGQVWAAQSDATETAALASADWKRDDTRSLMCGLLKG